LIFFTTNKNTIPQHKDLRHRYLQICFFSVTDRNVFEMTEKKPFRSECLKIQLMNTVMASFDKTVKQMTEMFQ